MSGLSDKIVAAWTKFAETGNPNGSGNSPWPRFVDQARPAFYSQNLPTSGMVSQAQFSTDHKCDYWYPVLGY